MLKTLLNTGRQKEGAGGYAQDLSAKLLAPGCSGNPIIALCTTANMNR